MRKLVRRPQPALVIALVALFVALGGTGYAAIAVTGKNVKNSSLTGKDVKNGSLGGKDVKESSLGKVRTATRADNSGRADNAGRADSAGRADTAGRADSAATADVAGRVGGLTLSEISYLQPAGSPTATVFEAAGLRISAGCAVGTEVSLVATGSVDDSSLFYTAADTDNDSVIFANDDEGGTFDAGTTSTLLDTSDGDPVLVNFVYEGRDGGTVTGQLATDESGGTCRVRGTAVSG